MSVAQTCSPAQWLYSLSQATCVPGICAKHTGKQMMSYYPDCFPKVLSSKTALSYVNLLLFFLLLLADEDGSLSGFEISYLGSWPQQTVLFQTQKPNPKCVYEEENQTQC